MRTICILLFFCSMLLQAQNEKPEREPFDLILKIDSSNYYGEKIGATPYFVKDKVLQIFPSEKVFIEAEIKGDSIHSMKVVKEILNPEKTITVEFKQKTKGKVHEQMMLTVTNPFDKQLKYEALIYINGYNQWKSTSIIPVYPKISSFELWQNLILSIVLVEWNLEDL